MNDLISNHIESNNNGDREHYSWRESSDSFSRTKQKIKTKKEKKKTEKLIIVYFDSIINPPFSPHT